MAVHEGESVVDSVRHYRHEDTLRGKQQAVEEHAVQRGVDEVRNRHRVQQLRCLGPITSHHAIKCAPSVGDQNKNGEVGLRYSSNIRIEAGQLNTKRKG